jgi:hypothetical protein
MKLVKNMKNYVKHIFLKEIVEGFTSMPRRVTAATSLAMDIVTYIVTKKSYFRNHQEKNTVIHFK